MNSAIMGTQSHLFKGKEKRRKKWSWCSFSLLLAVQWRWWKVRRHQMGWYTFIFSNEINHHHSYYHFHKPKEQDRESPHFHSVALVKLEIGSLESTGSWKKQMEASRKQNENDENLGDTKWAGIYLSSAMKSTTTTPTAILTNPMNKIENFPISTVYSWSNCI